MIVDAQRAPESFHFSTRVCEKLVFNRAIVIAVPQFLWSNHKISNTMASY